MLADIQDTFQRRISWEYANAHKWIQTCKCEPIGTGKRIPLWPESPYSLSPPAYPPDPCHRQSASQSNTHTHTHPLRHGGCLTPGPHRSLVWRPVCVCLASNGPFKCRIFTADRAILGDGAHGGLNMLWLHYPGGSYPYYHHTMPRWLAMRLVRSGPRLTLWMRSRFDRQSSQHL